MFDRKKIAASLLAVVLGAGLGGTALAASPSTGDSNGEDTQAAELQAIQNAKLTIADAAKAAETETGGKAVDVSIGDEDGQIAYQVEVVLGDGTMQEVRVDPQTGAVLKVSADDQDQEANGGEDENGEESESIE